MWTAITGLFSVVGQAVGGIFGLKKKQGEVVETAIGTLNKVAESDAAHVAAASNAIKAVYQYGNFIERSWRPLLMYVCMGLIIARWFGFSPPYLTPNEVDHLYTFLYIGISAYIPMRSLDKWMLGFQIGSVIKEFVRKKVL